jgi:hypothetical protein
MIHQLTNGVYEMYVSYFSWYHTKPFANGEEARADGKIKIIDTCCLEIKTLKILIKGGKCGFFNFFFTI